MWGALDPGLLGLMVRMALLASHISWPYFRLVSVIFQLYLKYAAAVSLSRFIFKISTSKTLI